MNNSTKNSDALFELDGGIVISNPGGFVEGVTLKNLLVVEPKPRNPVLADAIKRSDIIDLCKIGPHQASRLLGRLVDAGKLERYGQRRGTYYKPIMTKK